MDVVERYIYAVVRSLPERQREEVARELRTEIEDMIQGEGSGKKTKQNTTQVLQRLGNPSKLADQYRDKPRYLIGPEYFESYVQLLKTLLTILVPLIFALVSLSEMMSRATVFEAIPTGIAASLQVGLHLFFWVTISFMLTERFASNARQDDDWSLAQLPEVPSAQNISRNNALTGISWSVLAIILTLLQTPAVHAVVQPHVPLFFADAMWPWWVMGLLGISFAGLAVELLKLFVGRWTGWVFIALAVVNVLTISFFISLISVVDPIISPAITDLIQRETGQSGVVAATKLGVSIFVWSVIVISAYEIIDGYIRFRKGRSA